MEQLILHLLGDYVLQSDWMAMNKTRKKSWACFWHAFVYAVPFLLLTGARYPNWPLAVIFFTHFWIDKLRLARYVIWAKNIVFAPMSSWIVYETGADGKRRKNGVHRRYTWENCKRTGYPSQMPDYLAGWLLILADNTLHLACNYLALKYL